ncbi:hypothetical protein CYLTODRAFT_487074 [Cylindrobasidium torrendii FP15055 ss-10]|uniref:Uncharacterized protein n=1 Tax=Cylindrobasidium torrendii FP15055 ss-10 TaxID=1314674 RepID=A0A0D7BN75_9AGAR|nr:hypothetical protein CYLTODRAFT_487074 [Cylindrobasidium torrendii FP15055 ss-10]
MGGLCSKASNYSDGHQVLSSAGRVDVGSSRISTGSRPATQTKPAAQTRPAAQATTANDAAARAARAEAAEARLKAANKRGVNAANPKSGQLAAQANKPVKYAPEAPPEQRLVWD